MTKKNILSAKDIRMSQVKENLINNLESLLDEDPWDNYGSHHPDADKVYDMIDMVKELTND